MILKNIFTQIRIHSAVSLIFLLAFNTEFYFSQNYVDVLKIGASTTPENKFDSTDFSTSVTEFGVDLTAPVKINDKYTFLTGVIYENINVRLFPGEKIKTFSAVAIKLGLSAKLNERVSATFVGLPKLASDFVGHVIHKDFQIGGIALFRYNKTDNLNIKYGVYYNSEKFGPFFVPLLGVYYLSTNKKFELNALLPLQVDVNYRFIKLMNAGINFNGLVRTYHLSDVNNRVQSSYLHRSTNELFAYLRFNFGGKALLYLKCGQSFARYYRVYNDNDLVNFGMPLTYIGPKRSTLNTDFADGLIFQIGFTYRMEIKKPEN